MRARQRSPRRWRTPLTAAVALVGVAYLLSALYIPAKATLAQWLIHRAWSEAQDDGAPAAPWSWADTAAVGRLRAPAHGQDLIVLAGASGEAMAFGPGHIVASASPGTAGHTIIGGHRDTHFAFLENVVVGDRLLLEGLSGLNVQYQVSDVRAVDSTLEPLQLSPDDDRLTLVTCYPFDATVAGGPWRYVVHAVRLPTGVQP